MSDNVVIPGSEYESLKSDLDGAYQEIDEQAERIADLEEENKLLKARVVELEDQIKDAGLERRFNDR